MCELVKKFSILMILLGLSGVAFSQEMTIVISGDAMMHMPQISAASTPSGELDFLPCFSEISKRWESADFAIVNLETTVSPNGKYSGYPRFSSPSQFVSALKQSGIDICMLANNHIMDKGKIGAVSTLHCLDSLKLKHVGLSFDKGERFLTFSKGDMHVALLNYTYSVNDNDVPEGVYVNFIDTTAIRTDIENAKKVADHILVVYHLGEEYERFANRYQRELAEWTRQCGAEIVIGSHPHVIQNYNLTNHVVYSMGNLISNQYYKYTDTGMSVEIVFSSRHYPKITLFYHKCDREHGYHIVMIDKPEK